MKRQQIFGFVVFCVLCRAGVAQEPLCTLSGERTDTVTETPALVDTDLQTLASGKVRILAGTASITREGDIEVEDGIRISQGNQSLEAEEATYSAQTETFSVSGNVALTTPDVQIRGNVAEYETDNERVEFTDGEFTLPARPARGSAGRIVSRREGHLSLSKVTYTTCPEGEDDWALKAGDIDLDNEAGTGKARNVRIEFGGIPVLYTPYMSFPINDNRKSGILVPSIGNSDRTGTDISLPVYWNLAPNYDATITPRLMSKRGLQLKNEFRYLTKIHAGDLNVEYLPDDDITGDDRIYGSLMHQTSFSPSLRFQSQIEDASDSEYFEDLGASLSTTSQTHLQRHATVDHFGRYIDFRARVENYQTIDPRIDRTDRPYKRLPQLLTRATWPDTGSGFNLDFVGELVNFERDDGVRGLRLTLDPEVTFSLGDRGLFVDQSLGFQHTRYSLEEAPVGQTDEPSRSAPIYSFDAGLRLERFGVGEGNLVQTIEPRIQYVHIPFRNQDDLPVFDTGLPDFNGVQLFRKNRFIGYDRLGDTDQVSVGVSTRLLDADTGEQILTAALGQTYFLSDREVNLPDAPTLDEDASELIAELGLNLYKNWNMDLGYQWSTENDSTARAEIRVQYRPKGNKVLNLAYRYRKGLLEQTDMSFAWPLGGRWSVVGRHNFSLRSETTLERFAGVEYGSCCWAVRFVQRRHVSDRTGDSDTSLGLQFELKGFTSVGNSTDSLLERGILGYSEFNR